MLELIGLTRFYGDFLALDHLDLTVGRGEIFGFLGPNGAGKTTTIKMITGLLAPSSGRVRIGGIDISENPIEAKKKTGFMPDTPFLYDYLTPAEFLRFVADVRSMNGDTDERIARLLDELGLADKAGSYCADLSHGMKKKLAFAAAVLHEPELVILDEPTSGLDPLSVRVFRELVRELAGKGSTVFLSTHVLDVAGDLCSRLGIINRGRLVACGPPEELESMADGGKKDLEKIFVQLTSGEGDEAGGDGRLQ